MTTEANSSQDQSPWTQKDQNTWQDQQRSESQSHATGERTAAEQFTAQENQATRDFNRQEREASETFANQQRSESQAYQAREASKARAQNFLAQQLSNSNGRFSAAQDFTGGASSIGKTSFNPNGRKRKEMDYTFKPS